MSKRAAILRFDVSAEVGMGHFHRAVNLSKKLDDFVFAVPEGSQTILIEMGIAQDRIVGVSNGTQWLNDLSAFDVIITDICRDKNAKGAEEEILSLTQTNRKIVVIDGMPPDHYDPEPDARDVPPALVITPYLLAEKFRSVPYAQNWKTGASYGVLDSVYAEVRSAHIPRPKQPRLLLCCGGSDPTHLTLRCLELLQNFHGQVDIVVGPLFDTALVNGLERLCETRSDRVLHSQPKGLAHLIGGSSLLIGRPGLVRYEAAALGTNAIFLVETESYYDYYRGFNDAGLAEMFFAHRSGQNQAFSERLKGLASLKAEDPLFGYNTKSMELVSVSGAERMLEAAFGETST